MACVLCVCVCVLYTNKGVWCGGVGVGVLGRAARGGGGVAFVFLQKESEGSGKTPGRCGAGLSPQIRKLAPDAVFCARAHGTPASRPLAFQPPATGGA